MKLTSRLNLVPLVQNSWILSPVPLYAFMTCLIIGEILLYYDCKKVKKKVK